jgi:hypothetical protein
MKMLSVFRGVFERSPRKSTSWVSIELGISQTMVWHVLRQRLHKTPYKSQLLQTLDPNHHNRRFDFCIAIQKDMEEDSFPERQIFLGWINFPSFWLIATLLEFGGNENP